MARRSCSGLRRTPSSASRPGVTLRLKRTNGAHRGGRLRRAGRVIILGRVIRVLVVEDDHVAADAHRLYVERVPGFVVVGVAPTGAEAVRVVEQRPVDLVLL